MSNTTSSSWYVLYTRPRAEKKLAEQLQQDGITTYCPTQTKLKQWSDRKKKVEMPLLPSMIFVHIKDNERHRVFEKNLAIRYLYWLGQPARVNTQEIESLKAMLENSQFENHGLETLQPGEQLDMTKLGFEHVQGTVKFVSETECWIVLEQLGYVVKFKKT